MERGIVTDMEKIWHRAFYNEPCVALEESPRGFLEP
jgi:hypothetical protein